MSRCQDAYNDGARDDRKPSRHVGNIEQIVVQELVAGVLVDVVAVDRLRHVLAFFDEAGHAAKRRNEECNPIEIRLDPDRCPETARVVSIQQGRLGDQEALMQNSQCCLGRISE